MIKFKQLALLTLSTFLIYSCQKDLDEIESEELSIAEIAEKLQTRIPVDDEELLDHINKLQISVGAVNQGFRLGEDGKTFESVIYIGHDIAMPREAIMNMLPSALVLSEDGNTSRQYRTTNLVSPENYTITVRGQVGGQFGLAQDEQNALTRAVANYNNISNMGLEMQLSFGNGRGGADIYVRDETSTNPTSTGGVAGFPTSDGRPFDRAVIFGLGGFNPDIIEQIITHELGHCVGFRHSDWYDRRSCPAENQGNEGQGAIGAILLDGTPVRDDLSVMKACVGFDGFGFDGNFNNNDERALRVMYPDNGGGGNDDGGNDDDGNDDGGNDDGGNDITPPSRPRNLVVDSFSGSTADISWDKSNDNVGVVGYNVYVNRVLIGTTQNTSARLTNVRRFRRVFVTAIDAAGNESPASNTRFLF